MTDPIRLVELADLVGRAEIAQRAGIRLATVDTWRRRYDTFPGPIGEISHTPIWSWAEVEAWMVATPRLVGRPTHAGLALPPGESRPAPLPDRLRAAIRTAPPGETETA